VKALRSAFVMIVAVLSCAACSPTRSTLRPPYDLRGKQVDEPQLQFLAAEQCKATGPETPTHPFTTDGCTWWRDGSWVSCCIEHDFNYWCGGTTSQREKADADLLSCVSDSGHPGHARIMFIGVRMFGYRLLPFSWRWGYGYAWPYGEPGQ
jgi:hypothetical protein